MCIYTKTYIKIHAKNAYKRILQNQKGIHKQCVLSKIDAVRANEVPILSLTDQIVNILTGVQVID